MIILKTQKDRLLKPLQTVVGVVERKHTLPILSNVLIEAQGERTAFVATDLELQITTWLDGKIEKDGEFTVSARKLVDICRALPDETAVKLDFDKETLKIQAGKSRFNLQTLPARDFPRLQSGAGEGTPVRLDQAVLRRLLAKVQYAMAVQDIRYYLNGMLFSLQGKRLIVAATDGHRLAFDAAELDIAEETQAEVILPRKTVLELIKLLDEDSDVPVEIQIGANQVWVKHPNFELRSKVVDGRFPDYQRVIPSGYDKEFSVDRQLLQQSLNRAAILTNEKYRGVRMAMTSGALRLACSNNEQEDAQEELEIDYSAEPIDIGFNIQYLQDVLNNLDCETITCSFGDANSSMLITVPGETDFRYVVMPMRI
jgi:DNA polymerase-3 subunit beta